MEVGALKSMSGVWPIAGSILNQVKEVARGIFIFDPRSQRTAESLDRAGDDPTTLVGDELWADEVLDLSEGRELGV